MMIAARNAFLMGGGAPLPYDAEVEWLQGDGASGIVVPCNIAVAKFRVEFYRTSLQAQTFCESAHPSNSGTNDVKMTWDRASDALSRGHMVTLSQSNQNQSTTFSPWFSGSGQLSQKMWMALDIANSESAYWNGGGGSWTPKTAANISAIGLLCRALSTSTASTFSTGKICSFQVWQSGTLTHSLKPVRKNGVGAFYDEVSGTLWPVTGTGAFVVGPDK